MAAQRTHVALVHHRRHVARNWCHYGIGACAQVEVEHVTAEFVFVSCVSVKMSSEPKPDFDRSGACFLENGIPQEFVMLLRVGVHSVYTIAVYYTSSDMA